MAISTKCPVRLEVLFTPDATGFALKDVQGIFVYRFPDDSFAGGAEKAIVQLTGTDLKNAQLLFTDIMSIFIAKHATMSVADTLKAYPPTPVPVVSAAVSK